MPNEDDSEEILDRLPRNRKQLTKLLEKVNQKIGTYKLQFFKEQYELKDKPSKVD